LEDEEKRNLSCGSRVEDARSFMLENRADLDLVDLDLERTGDVHGSEISMIWESSPSSEPTNETFPSSKFTMHQLVKQSTAQVRTLPSIK
jgi:hypothetical protein